MILDRLSHPRRRSRARHRSTQSRSALFAALWSLPTECFRRHRPVIRRRRDPDREEVHCGSAGRFGSGGATPPIDQARADPMSRSNVLNAGTRCNRLAHNPRTELSVARPTPLTYNLDPRHPLYICGCHSGSHMPASAHAAQEINPLPRRQGGHRRRDTIGLYWRSLMDKPESRRSKKEGYPQARSGPYWRLNYGPYWRDSWLSPGPCWRNQIPRRNNSSNSLRQ